MLTFTPSQRVVLIHHTESEVQATVYTVTELIAELTGETPRNVTHDLSPSIAAMLGQNGKSNPKPGKSQPAAVELTKPTEPPKRQMSLPHALGLILGGGPVSRKDIARQLDQMGISYQPRYLSHVLWKQFKHLGHRKWSLPEPETKIANADKSCPLSSHETQATTGSQNRLV